MRKVKSVLIASFFLCMSLALAGGCMGAGSNSSSQESSVQSSESSSVSSVETSTQSSTASYEESSILPVESSIEQSSGEASVESSEESSEAPIESSEEASVESSIEQSSEEVSVESSIEESSEEVPIESSEEESSEAPVESSEEESSEAPVESSEEESSEAPVESSVEDSSEESSSDDEHDHAYGELMNLDGAWVYECIYCEDTISLVATEENDGLVDFLVEVEEGRDPVVLQLSDPQFSDWGEPNSYCFTYLQETIEAVNPDLILVTGDIVYGKFDEDGQFLLNYIKFMESFEIPWAPVFGNHDNECILGVDWQCEQFENATYCLFDQKTLTGNGNYSVGLLQGNTLLRVFYMLDSNGCDSPMVDGEGNHVTSEPGKNLVNPTAGFAQDQIDWYTHSITTLKTFAPEVKISFAYHIQQAVFEDAIEKYADAFAEVSASKNALNLDAWEGADAEDFGCIGHKTSKLWDTDYSIWNGMKALGVDSVFVGHEHTNSFSIVYEGVRLQFGQKSSMFDSYGWVFEDGSVQGGSADERPNNANPLIGGTVIPVSSVDGTIGKGYIYYGGDPFTFLGDSNVFQGDARTRMPVYSGDVTKLGFAEGSIVYALENSIDGGWGDTWTTRTIISAPTTQDYIALEFVSENDIVTNPFYLWGAKATPELGYLGFGLTSAGVIIDMEGCAVTGITAGEHYVLYIACAGLEEVQLGLTYGINIVYFTNITYNNGEIPKPLAPQTPIPDPVQGDNRTPLPTYDGDVTALGFAEGTTVYVLDNAYEGAWTTATWDDRAIIYAPSTQDYMTIEFVSETNIASSTLNGPFYIWGVAAVPGIGYIKLSTTDIGLITDMDGNAVTSIVANQHYLLHIACEGLSEIQIGSVYGVNTIYFGNITYNEGTFAAK